MAVLFICSLWSPLRRPLTWRSVGRHYQCRILRTEVVIFNDASMLWEIPALPAKESIHRPHRNHSTQLHASSTDRYQGGGAQCGAGNHILLRRLAIHRPAGQNTHWSEQGLPVSTKPVYSVGHILDGNSDYCHSSPLLVLTQQRLWSETYRQGQTRLCAPPRSLEQLPRSLEGLLMAHLSFPAGTW